MLPSLGYGAPGRGIPREVMACQEGSTSKVANAHLPFETVTEGSIWPDSGRKAGHAKTSNK